MGSSRLYIATRDPRRPGGVMSMARFVYETAEDAGYDPCLVCNALDNSMGVRTTDVLTLNVRREIEHTRANDMELKSIPRILPEVEFLQYVLNRRFWREALADGDVYFGVGGANHCCLPLALEGEPFSSWTATPFWEDRVDRLESASTLRQIRDYLSKPVMEWLEGQIYRRTETILALSEHTANAIANRHSIDRDRIEVVPYPVDTDLFNPDGLAKPDDDRPTVLFVGRFNDARKNTPLLLEAVNRLRDRFPDIRLLLIGDQPDTELQGRVDTLNLTENVEYINYVNNEKLPAYYRGADLFAIPSQQEGLAIVGLEAMACGTPVVSTRCGGPQEYVNDGETGYLVPVDDADAFADRIGSLLEENNIRELMGIRGRESMVESYNREMIRQAFTTVLKLLTKNNNLSEE